MKRCSFGFSVGGGNAEKNVSMNLVRALQTAKEVKASFMELRAKMVVLLKRRQMRVLLYLLYRMIDHPYRKGFVRSFGICW